MSLSLVLWCVWLCGIGPAVGQPLYSNYLNLPLDGGLHVPAGVYFPSGVYTIEFWFRMISTTTFDVWPVVTFGQTSNNNDLVRMVWTWNGGSMKAGVQHYSAGGVADTMCVTNSDLNAFLGTWTHLAVVYTGPLVSSANVVFYVNGIPSNSPNIANIVPTTSSRALPLLWRDRLAGGRHLAEYADFRLWSTVRTAAQINASYTTALVGNEVGLQLYYRLNTCGASQVPDLSPSNANGTLVNITTIVCAPTPAPTAAPTRAPTAVPTVAPTAVPTAVPTAGPTAVPTAVPTAGPTAVPTAAPTARPTAQPTAAPTAMMCLMGQFTNSTPACQSCSAGTYTNSTTATVCAECVLGYFSGGVGATGCTACAPGRAANATGQSACHDCTTGFFAPASAATSCDVCLGSGNATTCSLTLSPTAAPTAVPTALPTATPTQTPTAAPSATPTALPTATPTTASPTATPTLAPTAVPTATPTAAPTTPPLRETVLLTLANATRQIILVAPEGVTATAESIEFTECGDRAGWSTLEQFDLVGTFTQPVTVRVTTTAPQRRVGRSRDLFICPSASAGWTSSRQFACALDAVTLPARTDTFEIVRADVCHNTPFAVQETEPDGDCHNLPRWCYQCTAGHRGCGCELDGDAYVSLGTAAWVAGGATLIAVVWALEATREELYWRSRPERPEGDEGKPLMQRLGKGLSFESTQGVFEHVLALVLLLGVLMVLYPTINEDSETRWSTTTINADEYRGFWIALLLAAGVAHWVRTACVWHVGRSRRDAWLVFAVTVAEAGMWFGAWILPLVAMMESRKHDSQSTTLPSEWSLFAGAVAVGLGVYVLVAGTVAFFSDRGKWASLAGLVVRVVAALFLGAVWAIVSVRLPCE